LFYPGKNLAECFTAALQRLGGAYPQRVTDLRASSLFFFVLFLMERGSSEPHSWNSAQDGEAGLKTRAPQGQSPPVLLITETTARAVRMAQFVAAAERLWHDREPEVGEVLVFPDFEPQNLFEYFDPPLEVIDQRNKVLDGLRQGTARVVVTSYKACWRLLPELEEQAQQQLHLTCSGDFSRRPPAGELANPATKVAATGISRIHREALAAQLVNLGYNGVSTVTEPGQFAVRGGLVDVFPIGAELPARIDLFGDEVDALSQFDPGTQRSTGQLGELRILPVSAHGSQLRHPGVQAWLREQWQAYRDEYEDVLSRSAFERLAEVVENDLALLAEGGATPRAGWYYHATLSESTTLWNYLPAGTHVVVHEEGFVESETNSYFRFWESRHADWLKNGLGFLRLSDSYLLPADGIRATAQHLAAGRLPASLLGEDGAQVTLDVPRLRLVFTSAFGGPEGTGDGWPLASVGLDTPPAGKWGTTRLAETLRGYPKLDPPVYRSEVGARPSQAADPAEPARKPALPAAGVNRVDRPVTLLSQFSARLREVLTDEQLAPEIENAILPGGFVVPAPVGTGLAPAATHFRSDDGDSRGTPRPSRTELRGSMADATSGVPTGQWTVVTDVEVFGEIAEVETAPPRRYRTHPVRRTDELSPGDYVVHIDYGIGRFAQLANRDVGGVEKTYAAIEYAGRDRLYVPVEQLDRLRRYSFDGSEPALNSLGKDSWKKTKEKVKRDTLELAKKLLSLYKLRQVRPGHAYGEGTVWEQEFAEGFPYELTDDQRQAWSEVQQDMEAAKPMDRLIVGDVGFGKTEVAMRAAFKACVDERQALILCPTTVLADQHFTTFTRRFRPFPFRVGVLSRFQSAAEQKDTLDKVRTGRVDVLIATHRGLSKDVEFQRLGLLVIDEEQRFGVKQKEKLRMQFPTVDVLAMSATPIPRTLHMSLVGVRDISVIETAPTSRKPVKTYVGEQDEMLIREALLRELGRGGQVYYLHNRVQDIDTQRKRLEEMLPGEKVIVAHGQMADEKLEEVMHAFSLGAYKVMLATTIIENGLDIPAVNTIIVDNAELLGLAQMHQLRGRVGRSSAQAYAYFFHHPTRLLSEDAQRRLHAIYNYAYLGAGYEIAQSDLRIRGAGNLLGEEQSGLARAVGFEYYCELLARSISDVKALDEVDISGWDDKPLVLDRPSAQVDLPLPCYIPDEYIQDPVLRLEILRDIAALDSEASLAAYADELEDRFGPPPQEALNLLTAVRLRNLATQLGLERLAYSKPKQQFTLQFHGGPPPEWTRRILLLDERYALAQPGALVLNLPLGSAADVDPLADALTGLLELRG
jgi:transcription-repair coupling factor